MGQHLATFSGPQQERLPTNDRSTTPPRPPYRGRYGTSTVAGLPHNDQQRLLTRYYCFNPNHVSSSRATIAVPFNRHPDHEEDHGGSRAPGTMA